MVRYLSIFQHFPNREWREFKKMLNKEVRESECYIPYIARMPLTSSSESTALLLKEVVIGVMMEPGTLE